MKNLYLALTAATAFGVMGCQETSPSPAAPDMQFQSGTIATAPVDNQVAVEDRAPRAGRVESKVNAVNTMAGTVTIGKTTVITNVATKIERNGVRVQLSAFRIGDFGQARLIGTSMLASKVEARGN
jgi:Mrp family chromosome partitioning ATPase